jgi:hypothetical protein
MDGKEKNHRAAALAVAFDFRFKGVILSKAKNPDNANAHPAAKKFLATTSVLDLDFCSQPQPLNCYDQPMANSTRAKRIAFTALTWLAAILSLYPALVLFGIWFIVPLDPNNSAVHNLMFRIAFTACALLCFIALIALARWTFKKSRNLL